MFTDADIIYRITRKDLLDSGDLVDVTEHAQTLGFLHPVAVTRAVWIDCVEWTEHDRKDAYQDQKGRLHDLLWMVRAAIAQAPDATDTINVLLYRVERNGEGPRPSRCWLKAMCGPGDNGEPVLTVLMPDED